VRIALVATDRDVTRACTHVLPTGVSTHVMALARGLVDVGHEVTLLTGRDDAEGVDLSFRHESGGGLRIVRLSRDSLDAVPAGQGRLSTELAAVLDAAAPDVVHAHGTGASLLARDLASMAGVPWVAQLHELTLGGEPLSAAEARARRSERELLRSADRVVCLASDAAAAVAGAGVCPDSIDVVPRAIDPTVFDVRGPSLPRARRPRIIGVVDDYGPTSGLTELVKAVSYVPDVDLLVVGGPPRGAAAADSGLAQAYLAARQLGVSDRLHVTGRLSPTRLAETMRGADVVVWTPWAAPAADHVLEAMSCAKAVIASAVGGAHDVVEQGVTGICIPAQSSQRLTDALRLVLCDRDQRAQMGQHGRRRAVDHFSLRTVVSGTVATYQRALAARGQAARAS